MATLCGPLERQEEANNPNIVKVVCDADGRALYFSRSAIPFVAADRKGRPSAATEKAAARRPWLRHIGIYAFRHAFLQEFASWARADLELTEGLEQLRALAHGRAIRVLAARGRYIGVDTPEDVVAVENAIRAGF